MLSSVLVLVAYFGLWALVHSLLASLLVKRWAARTFGAWADRGYRVAFNAVAAASLVPMLALVAVLPDRSLYQVGSPWRWLMVAGQVLALVGLTWAFLLTRPMVFLGLTQLFYGGRVGEIPLQTGGIYDHVRHPLFLFSLILVWLTPSMTCNLLTLYAAITLYFAVGSIHEEKLLVAEFGSAYEAYRERVPRLIPRLISRSAARTEKLISPAAQRGQEEAES